MFCPVTLSERSNFKITTSWVNVTINLLFCFHLPIFDMPLSLFCHQYNGVWLWSQLWKITSWNSAARSYSRVNVLFAQIVKRTQTYPFFFFLYWLLVWISRWPEYNCQRWYVKRLHQDESWHGLNNQSTAFGESLKHQNEHFLIELTTHGITWLIYFCFQPSWEPISMLKCPIATDPSNFCQACYLDRKLTFGHW